LRSAHKRFHNVRDEDLNRAGGPYHVQLLATSSELEDQAPEIEQFLLNEVPGSVFEQNPYVLLAEHRRNANLNPLGFIIRDKGRIVCTVLGYVKYRPFYLTFSVFRIPGPRLRVLVLTGTGPCICKDRDPTPVMAAFLNALQAMAGQIDIIYLDQVEVSSPLLQFAGSKYRGPKAFLQAAQASPKIEIISRHMLRPCYEDWYGAFDRKTKKRVSWELSRFKKRAPQPVSVECITTERQVARFMEHVEAVRKDTWQARTFEGSQTSLDDNIAYFNALARRGWLRSYLMMCGGKPAAYELAVQYGSEVAFLERGYVQALSSIGPGTYLTYFIMKDCYANQPPESINFGYGENDFKKRLRTHTCDACCSYLTMPNKGRLLVKAQKVLNYVEVGVSELLNRTGLDHKVRRFLKKKNR